MFIKKVLIALAVLLIGCPAFAGIIYFDAANFYCPDNGGVACCDKVTYDADQRTGATHGNTVMECDPGESFFLRLPIPNDSTPTGNTHQFAFVTVGHGTGNTDTGQICYTIAHEVEDMALDETPKDFLTFPFGTPELVYSASSTASASTQFRGKLGLGVSNAPFALFNGRTNAVCATDIECRNDWMTVRFSALNGPSGSCTDPMTGKTFVMSGQFNY